LSPRKRNAKINKQSIFNPEWLAIKDMTKCPRCRLEQEESTQCAYCGLVFEEFRESARNAKAVPTKRYVLLGVILVAAGALLAAYLLIPHQEPLPGKSAGVEQLNELPPETGEKDLRTTVKELSGDVGILSDFTAGHTRSSIIAMLIFSIIGLGYFAYGKKSRQFLMLVCGIALMGYSYFVNGTGYIVLIGIGLSALPFIVGRK
jgi:hypothetical protein